MDRLLCCWIGFCLSRCWTTRGGRHRLCRALTYYGLSCSATWRHRGCGHSGGAAAALSTRHGHELLHACRLWSSCGLRRGHSGFLRLPSPAPSPDSALLALPRTRRSPSSCTVPVSHRGVVLVILVSQRAPMPFRSRDTSGARPGTGRTAVTARLGKPAKAAPEAIKGAVFLASWRDSIDDARQSLPAASCPRPLDSGCLSRFAQSPLTALPEAGGYDGPCWPIRRFGGSMFGSALLRRGSTTSTRRAVGGSVVSRLACSGRLPVASSSSAFLGWHPSVHCRQRSDAEALRGR